MMTLFTVACHNPGTLSLSLPKLPLTSSPFSSSLLSVYIGSSQGGGSSEPPRVQTCHSRGSGGGGGYLPPESLPCPEHGGAQSESGGWCASSPAPCSPPTVHPMDPTAIGKKKIYSLDSGVARGVAHWGGCSFPFWGYRWNASNPATNSISYSRQ